MKLHQFLAGMFLSLMLGACNTVQTTQPTLQPGVLSPSNLAAAGLTPAQVSKVTAAAQKASQYAQALGTLVCPVLPLAEGVANVLIAEQVSSPTGQTVKAGVTLACQALASAPTYSSTGDGLVRATVDVKGYGPVTVYGRRR